MGIRGPKGARARADRWHWTLELVKFPDAASFPVARIACHGLDSSRLNIVFDFSPLVGDRRKTALGPNPRWRNEQKGWLTDVVEPVRPKETYACSLSEE